MPRFSQVDEDFDVIDLLRAVPSAVAYAIISTHIPVKVRHELHDVLTDWEDENSCASCEEFVNDPDRRVRRFPSLCIECEALALEDQDNDRRYAEARDNGTLRVV